MYEDPTAPKTTSRGTLPPNGVVFGVILTLGAHENAPVGEDRGVEGQLYEGVNLASTFGINRGAGAHSVVTGLPVPEHWSMPRQGPGYGSVMRFQRRSLRHG